MKDYKKILKGVVNIIATTEKTDIGFANICSYLSDNCDELFESEDEKIRKELYDFCIKCSRGDTLVNQQVDFQRWAAWLEKQGEKPQGKSALEAIKEKPANNANKVEPKFKAGDWVVWENQYYKVNYNGCGYELIDQMGLRTSLEYGTVDENAHLWDTTKDAKDGDVLVSDNIVFIFNKIHDAWINCHCSTHKDGSFMEEDYDLMTIKYSKEVYPATKEQCDKLLKAMADAGYTFDFDKKELKKIEKPTAWSEEDERMMLSIEQIMNCASLLNIVPQKIDKVRAWLKSIKERIE